MKRLENKNVIVTGGSRGIGAYALVPHQTHFGELAGTGISHSEMNASADEPFHSFQVWIYPKHLGATPRYERFVSVRQQRHRG